MHIASTSLHTHLAQVMVNTQTVTAHDGDNVSNDQLHLSVVKAVSKCSSNRGGQLM